MSTKLFGMKLRTVVVLTALLAVIIFIGSGCTGGGATESTTNPNGSNGSNAAGFNVKDNKGIYNEDDDYSVANLYLTVYRGTETDNTDHSWSDINDNSVYFYERLNIDRYRVEGLLQEGDANGPKSGMYGFNDTATNAIVSIRGRTTSRGEQKSYKIELKQDSELWREQRTIALNKHIYDSVRFRNKLSYDLIKDIPDMIGLRTQFVRLYVRDYTDEQINPAFVDYGLYTQVEQPNGRFLKNHGLDEQGQLYKATMFEFKDDTKALKLITDNDYDLAKFEEVLEVKGNTDHSKLINMVKDLNTMSKPIESVFNQYFDEDNYFTWLAFQLLTGNTDTTSQNFYLYSPQFDTKFYFISWDNDGAWANGERELYKGKKGYNYEDGISNYWGSVLPNRLLREEKYRKILDEHIEEMKKYLSEGKINTLVNRYTAVTKPFLFSQPDIGFLPRSQEQYNSIIPTIAKEVQYNYNMYKESLTRPTPFYINQIEKTGGKYFYSWDTSIDLNNEAITYTFELSEDYTFNSPSIIKKTGLKMPNITLDELSTGLYFYRVTAVNESGKTQTAMESYVNADDLTFFGIKSIRVLADGTIQEA